MNGLNEVRDVPDRHRIVRDLRGDNVCGELEERRVFQMDWFLISPL